MSNYETFLEKYCYKHDISREEAEQHVVVKEYKEQCKEKAKRISKTEIVAGCGSALATAVIFIVSIFLISSKVQAATTAPTIYEIYSEEEVQLLFRVVETETHGAEYEPKKNVASVVLNRQELYAKPLKDIITAPNQFAYSKKKITETTVKACEDALYDRGAATGALFFRSDKRPDTFCGRPFLMTDTLHNFY